ncbi:MAG: flagellar biosynthesis anti-sigma factor FlgM [Lachnospiraceae bacterium]|nr:flagellar biosynthesis anti-sigma factor FlgM [Lachnospiraceae bacterium]
MICMRIDTFNKISQVYQTSKPKKTSGSVTEGSRDSLELSRAGNDFVFAKAAVQAAPDIRQDRVDAIRQQLASGTYSVSGQDIAERLVERYLDLKA